MNYVLMATDSGEGQV